VDIKKSEMVIGKDNKMKRVNIMGSAPGWEEVPEDNGAIWGVNNTHILRDVDLIIDIHQSRLQPTEEKDLVHLKLLREKDIPTYAIEKMEGFPNVRRYPIEEIKKEFNTDYFGSGIDFLIALAIHKGATDIHMYGVWMKKGGEYDLQKPSVEFWIGYAMGRGINFEVHGNTEILRTHNGLVYGYQTPQKWVDKEIPNHISLKELIERFENNEDLIHG